MMTMCMYVTSHCDGGGASCLVAKQAVEFPQVLASKVILHVPDVHADVIKQT